MKATRDETRGKTGWTDSDWIQDKIHGSLLSHKSVLVGMRISRYQGERVKMLNSFLVGLFVRMFVCLFLRLIDCAPGGSWGKFFLTES